MRSFFLLVFCLFSYQYANSIWVYDQAVIFQIRNSSLVLDGSDGYLTTSEFTAGYGQIWTICPLENGSVIIRNVANWTVIEFEQCQTGSHLTTTVGFENATQEWYLDENGIIYTYCNDTSIMGIHTIDNNTIILGSITETATLTPFEVILWGSKSYSTIPYEDTTIDSEPQK